MIDEPQKGEKGWLTSIQNSAAKLRDYTADTATATIEDFKLSSFDTSVLKDHPDQAETLALLPRAQKLKLIDGYAQDKSPDHKNSQDDIAIALYDATVLKTAPDQTDSLAQMDRAEKLRIIALSQDKNNPNAAKDAEDATRSALTDIGVKNTIGPILGGIDSFLDNMGIGHAWLDGLMPFITHLLGWGKGEVEHLGSQGKQMLSGLMDGTPLGSFLGPMLGLKNSAQQTGPDGKPALLGVSKDFQLANDLFHGSVESEKGIYHLRGTLSPEDQKDLDAKGGNFVYDKANDETIIRAKAGQPNFALS